MGDIIIVKFKVESTIEGKPVFTMDTVFGFFDAESMKSQKGIPSSDVERMNFDLDSNYSIDLLSYPERYFKNSTACLPSSKLLMIDRIVAFYPDGGKNGLGYIRSEKDVRKSEWFFKAHFFQDPVQPGSLGIEAILQLIQFYMLDQNLHEGFDQPVFEPVLIGDETEWHYRGQVIPDNDLISVDFDIEQVEKQEGKVTLVADARLWVDGLKIYQAPKIGMRIIEQSNSSIPLQSELK